MCLWTLGHDGKERKVFGHKNLAPKHDFGSAYRNATPFNLQSDQLFAKGNLGLTLIWLIGGFLAMEMFPSKYTP